MVGAEPRLPATAMNPQSRKETMIPISPSAMACQNETPKSSTNAPYPRPRTEMLAANQGQNRSRGRPLRSASVMTLMPLASIWSGFSSD